MSNKKYSVRVYHSYYGCQTGCCGHRVELTDENGKEFDTFEFEHISKEEAREFAERVIKDSWPECLPSIDWDTLQIDEVGAGCDW